MNDSKLIFSFRCFPGVSVEEASVQDQLVMGRDEGENKGVKNSLQSPKKLKNVRYFNRMCSYFVIF